MTVEDWTGGRLGDGRVVVSADWGDGRPPTGDMAAYASVGPDHRPVRVPYDRLAAFFAEHEDALFVSRDGMALAAPLLARGSATAAAVAARTKAGMWVDVSLLLQAVTDQHCGFLEKLDTPALRALNHPSVTEGGNGVGLLVGALEGLRNAQAMFALRTADHTTDHRLVAGVYELLVTHAEVLNAQAAAMTREDADTDTLPDDDGADAVGAGVRSSPLGNRVEVWAAVVGRHLDRAELAVDTKAVAGFRRSLDTAWGAAWDKAGQYGGLRECFDGNRKPVTERLTDWLADESENLVDEDQVEFTPPALPNPPSLEGWGRWASASYAVAACRELLRCHALHVMLDECRSARLTGTRDRPFSAYLRVATAGKCPLFRARPQHELWVVRPYASRLHTLSAVLDARGNTGGIPRLPFLLRATAHEPESGDVYLRIAAALAWHSGTRPHSYTHSEDDDEAAGQLLREFVCRHEQGDTEVVRWVATARGLLDTVAFGVDLDILRLMLKTEYSAGIPTEELRKLRSMLSSLILPELSGYWDMSRVWVAARRLCLPAEDVYSRLQDRLREQYRNNTKSVGDPTLDGKRQDRLRGQDRNNGPSLRTLRESLNPQLMGDVIDGGEGPVVVMLNRVRRACGDPLTTPAADILRSLMLTRTLTPGGRVAGPAYPAEVRRREFDMACEELTLGIAHELIADGFGVAAVTPDEILLEEPAGRVTREQIRESAEAGACRVLGEHAPPIRATDVQRW